MAAVKPSNWMMKGQVVVSCNCDYGCPCNVNGRPSTGKCEGGWTWHIEQGAQGDVRLDGLNIGLYCNWPAAIHEGNGVATYLIDERADEPQRAALRVLLEGNAGGPWGIFRRTFSQLHGPRYVRYEVDGDTNLPRVLAADALAVDLEYIRNPVTGETIHPRVVLPEGLVVKEAALVATKQFKVKDDHVSYDHSGRYGAFGFFQYFGP